MDLNEMKARLEAVLFAYAEPLTPERLAERLDAEVPVVEKVLQTLSDEMQKPSRGVELIRLENAWQLATKPACGDVVKTALDTRRNAPLTPAALEVLAIVAYNQPVSRSFIEQVRQVADSSSTISNLSEKGLIAEAGRLDLPGRPIAYRTTDAFLRTFGLNALSELPPLHPENPPEDESALYARPLADAAGAFADDDGAPAPDEATRALRGGAFIEGEGGAARFAYEDE